MSNKNKKNAYGFIALVALTTLAMAVPALADTTTPGMQTNNSAWTGGTRAGMMNRGNMKPGVYGTVSAISGNTITVTGKQGFGASATATTFTVDATNAKITKNNVAGTISSIVVGDTIMAQGTLTGTNLVATTIRDGQIGKGTREGQTDKTAPVSPITGNGQPIVAGTVASISGSTLTITNKSNVSYTIDATNAKIVRGQDTITISGVAVGDMIVAQGTVNGNAVIASSVIDQTKLAGSTTTTGGTADGGTAEQSHSGFFAGIGSFFAHLFGF